MMWVTKAKSASGAGRGRLLPGLETKQPGLEPIVGEAFQPSGEKKSRTRRAHCLRRQRVCLIFFIFLLFCLLCLCSAASETQDRSLEDAAKALTPERKASHSEVPASVGERVKKGNLQWSCSSRLSERNLLVETQDRLGTLLLDLSLCSAWCLTHVPFLSTLAHYTGTAAIQSSTAPPVAPPD
ncbi:hypothetical protein Esti_006361 [Eimeria stiedai]